MPEVLPWQAAEAETILHRAVAALAAGRLVVLPSETGYTLAAGLRHTEAVERLEARNGSEDHRLTLTLATADQALEWVPEMSALGRRLMKRCWPGPVTLVFERVQGGRAGQLPEPVRRGLCGQGKLAVHVPEHEVLQGALHQLQTPLIVRSAAGESAEQAWLAWGEKVDLVIDTGPSPGPANSVVEVSGSSWTMVHEGAVPRAEVELQTRRLIVFLCTGNTCRSPLAEALCKHRLSERLQCSPEELPQRGYLIFSAGLAAMLGDRATPEAQEAARELGVDLSGHVSRPLFPDLAEQADLLIVMTAGHRAILERKYPALGCLPRLLCPEGQDIPDPIGGSAEVYRDCAREIARHVDALLPELEQP